MDRPKHDVHILSLGELRKWAKPSEPITLLLLADRYGTHVRQLARLCERGEIASASFRGVLYTTEDEFFRHCRKVGWTVKRRHEKKNDDTHPSDE